MKDQAPPPAPPARLSPEREAEIRANEFWGPAECRTCVSVLLREIDALRSDLAELVAMLPRCLDCEEPASRRAEDRNLCCDVHGKGPFTVLPWSHVLRRLGGKP